MIIAGEISGRFLWADDICVAITTHEPITEGHALVIPRSEVEKFTDLDEETFAHLSVVAQRIGRAQIRAFDVPRAMTVIAGLEVPHVHIHVIPARTEADIRFDNAHKGLAQDILDTGAIRLREGLRKEGWGAYVPVSLNSPLLR